MEVSTNQQKPDNYLVWAILTTLLCCMPFGIVSIVKSTQVDSLWASGNYNGAVKAAEDAKKWALIGAGSGLVVMFLYLIIMLIVAIAG
jgi:hypothetical protein